MAIIGHLIQLHNTHGYCVSSNLDNFMSVLTTFRPTLIAKIFVPDVHKQDVLPAGWEGVGGHF
jgi:hypothetical protein